MWMTEIEVDLTTVLKRDLHKGEVNETDAAATQASRVEERIWADADENAAQDDAVEWGRTTKTTKVMWE